MNYHLSIAKIGLFATIGAFCALLQLASCSPEKIDFNDTDSENVDNETVADGVFSESQDLTSVTVSSDNATEGGRLSGGPKIVNVADPRLSCAEVTLTVDDASTIFVPKGILVIDFGTGCTDNRGNVRKGIIRIEYNGRRFLPGAYVVTTLDNYEINGIKISGVRTVTNTSGSTQANPSFTTVMTGGEITWPDGSTTSRDERTRMELKPGVTAADTEYWITGSATGKNRNDVDYSVSISDKLVYKVSCVLSNKIIMPVQGSKDLIVNSKKISLDYGDGSCDRLVTVTIRSHSKQIELNGNN